MPQRIKFEGTVHVFPNDFSDADISAALGSGSESPRGSSGSVLGPVIGAASNAGRNALVHAGEEIATAPAVGKAVGMLSKPVAQAAARAIGVTGGLPGYVAGEALSNPAVGKAAEAGIRGSGGLLAKVAGSEAAKVLTGPLAVVASMPFTDAGDRPAGETLEATTKRQAKMAFDYKDMVNRDAGRELIHGNTPEAVLDSIAQYQRMKKGSR
jgi:hypothetical protein